MSTKANAQMRADGSESVQKFTCSLARAHVEILQDPMVPADIGKILASDSVTQTQFSTKRCQLKTPHRWMDSPVTSSEGEKEHLKSRWHTRPSKEHEGRFSAGPAAAHQGLRDSIGPRSWDKLDGELKRMADRTVGTNSTS